MATAKCVIVDIHTSQKYHPELTEYFSQWVVIRSTYTFDEEYGDQLCGIMPTPGYSNNGTGKNTKLHDGEKMQYPAYQSVGIAVRSVDMTDDFVKQIQALASEFAEKENIKILGYRMVVEEAITKSEEYAIPTHD
jgi:hypothetical protein